MVIYRKCHPEYYAEVYLLLPTFMVSRKIQAIGGDQRDTKINLNLFTFNLTQSPLYVMMEIGIIIGLGIKIIDKCRR